MLEKIKKYRLLLLVIIAGILASRFLLFNSGYFIMHDDLQMMRQLEIEKCFLDLQIPCRWVPDMGYGFGFPLFNYYPPLPYLVGELVRVLGFSFTSVAKLNFAMAIILSGIAMYLLAKEFFGRFGGALSAIFYIWAPYHALDIYVRGAMNESWALVFFPFIFWTGYKLITVHRSRFTILLALSWAGLLLTHNLMVLIFAPVFLIWCLLFLLRKENRKNIFRLIIRLFTAGLLALGLSAFFTLPAFFEQKYVHIGSLVSDYYEYFAHYVSIKQLLISRFWGDGPSTFGINDGMAFPVGHFHWILSLIILVVLTVLFLRKKLNSKLHTTYYILLFFILVGWFSAFMAHERSIFIWKLFPQLAFVQFPWRFLAISTFVFSFLAGSISLFVNKKILHWVFWILTVGVVVWNWNFFWPVRSGPLSDSEKFSGEAWRLQQQAGIRDYLPISAKDDPEFQRRSLAEIVDGKGETSDESWGTNWARFDVNVGEKTSQIIVNIYKFPNWKTYLDGKLIKTYVPEEEKWGRMWVDIPQGEHQILLKFKNTPIRILANFISLICWLGLIGLPLWKKKMLQFKRGR